MTMSEYLALMAVLVGGVALCMCLAGHARRLSHRHPLGMGLNAVAFMLMSTSAALTDDDSATFGFSLITLALAMRFLMLVRAAPSGARR